MIAQLDNEFWICVALVFIVAPLLPGPAALRFSCLNLCAFIVVFGVNALITAALFTALLWVFLRLAQQFDPNGDGLLGSPWTVIGVTLLALAVYKIGQISPGDQDRALDWYVGVLATISFSYAALRAIDAVTSINEGDPLVDPVSFFGYLFPFFMMPAGPILAYQDYVEWGDNTTPRGNALYVGWLRAIELIIWGLFFKFVLAETWRWYFIGVSGSWDIVNFYDSASAFFYIYLDFMGYSTIALGIGRLLGVPTPVNFDKPLLAQSITDFWTRWHMSLGEWVKRNIYFPILLVLQRKFLNANQYLLNVSAVMLSFLFVGLWHQISLGFVVWGVLLGLILNIEKYVRDTLPKRVIESVLVRKIWRVAGPVYVLTTIIGLLHVVAMESML